MQVCRLRGNKITNLSRFQISLSLVFGVCYCWLSACLDSLVPSRFFFKVLYIFVLNNRKCNGIRDILVDCWWKIKRRREREIESTIDGWLLKIDSSFRRKKKKNSYALFIEKKKKKGKEKLKINFHNFEILNHPQKSKKKNSIFVLLLTEANNVPTFPSNVRRIIM